MSLLMIHKAYMPVYSDPDFSCTRDGRDKPTKGSTRGPKKMTKADKKLCLQWNDFSFVFGDLRQDNEFTDVTLARLETFFYNSFSFLF